MINAIKRWTAWLAPRPKAKSKLKSKVPDNAKLERAAEKRQRKNLKRSAQMQTQNSEGFYENQ